MTPSGVPRESDHGTWIVFCSDCSLRLDEPEDMELGTRPPCPECGSTGRSMRWTGANAGHVLIRSKVRRKAGDKRSPIETMKGDVMSSTGKWLRIHRIVDRRHDWYYEKVHDPVTREVIHLTEHPLREHIGHGDARKRKREQKDSS